MSVFIAEGAKQWREVSRTSLLASLSLLVACGGGDGGPLDNESPFGPHPIAYIAAADLDWSGSRLIILDSVGDASPDTILAGLPNWVESPAWSRDHSKLAVAGWTGGEQRLYVVDVASRSATSIPNLVGGARPQWSNGGEWIVFAGDSGIMRVHPDGTGLLTLASQTGTTVFKDPSVSPDGMKIAAVRSISGTSQIVTFNLDGTDLHLWLSCDNVGTTYKERCYTPAWSPDGTMMIFQLEGAATVRTVLIAPSADASAMAPLYQESGGYLLSAISWSPDGTRVLSAKLGGPGWIQVLSISVTSPADTLVLNPGATTDSFDPAWAW